MHNLRRARTAAAAVAMMVALGAAACGGDDDDEASDDGAGAATETSETTATDEDTTDGGGSDDDGSDDDGSDGGGGAGGPCDVVDAAAVEAALGESIGTGEAGATSVTENDLSWTADGCEWETDGDIELELRMVATDALPGECPPLSSPVYEISEVPDLGDAAWFEFDEMQGEGAVRVCAAAGMAESRIESDDTPLDEATVRATALALVTPAVAAL